MFTLPSPSLALVDSSMPADSVTCLELSLGSSGLWWLYETSLGGNIGSGGVVGTTSAASK